MRHVNTPEAVTYRAEVESVTIADRIPKECVHRVERALVEDGPFALRPMDRIL